MTITPKPRWYVAVAQPSMDVRVARDLADHQYEAFIMLTYTRAKSGNRAWVETELMWSPYVFVCVDSARGQSLKFVRDTFGVAGILSMTPDKEDDEILNATEIPAEQIVGFRLDQIAEFAEALKPPSRQKESVYKKDDKIIVRFEHKLVGGQVGTVMKARRGTMLAEFGSNHFPVWLREDDVAPAEPFTKQPRRA